jgi:MFS family permease
MTSPPRASFQGRGHRDAASRQRQGLASFRTSAVSGSSLWLLAAALLGLGTALVYPTLLAAVADVAAPVWRGAAVGVYRFWRDLGFAVGAVVGGVLADRAGVPFAIGAVAVLTAASGGVVLVRLRETRPRWASCSIGNPAAAHASNPPTMSVARSNPMSRSVAAARLDE